MRRRDKNKATKHYSLENMYTDAIVQLTEENLKLKAILYKKHGSHLDPKVYKGFLDNEMASIVLNDNELMIYLRQIDKFNTIAKKAITNRGKLQYDN